MSDTVRRTTKSGQQRGVALAAAVALALSPAIAVIWSYPWFVTQDGPAHLYNAQILAESTNPASPYSPYYSVRHQPLPNWAGHILYLVLVKSLPSASADRAATTLTLIALSTATAWLRFRVTGGQNIAATAAFACLLGLNVTWLFGFTGFLLGAALFPITLGVWWGGRNGLTIRRTLAITLLIVVGYFCHPVSLGLTAYGLAVLAILTPNSKRSTRLRTFATLLPLVPLGLIYRGLTRSGGPMRPEWAHLTHPFSLRSWASQLGWVDPISLAGKVYRPFESQPSLWNGLAAPVVWLVVALGAILVGTIAHRDRELRGWGVLAGTLLVAGLVGPDTLGTNHGHYLPQRIVLLGLVAFVPWLRLDHPGRLAQFGRAGLLVALILQLLFVWDYGFESQRSAGRLMLASAKIGKNQRVAAVLLDIRGRFRANPLLHADCLLGVGTGNIIWGNYETSHYYFPVQLRDPDNSPSATELEAIARLEGQGNATARAVRWARFLERHESKIDRILMWGHDAAIDTITAGRFFPLPGPSDDLVRVWQSKSDISATELGLLPDGAVP